MQLEEQEQSVRAYVALGSNIEDRERYLQQAIEALDNHPHIHISACSSIYETVPVGYIEQEPFLNMAIALDTTLGADQLLHVMLGIEQQLGRTRDVRWGPRTLDLDMLIYGKELISTPDLTIPHPRMHERAFVLVPLAEVLNEQRDPLLKEVATQLVNIDGKEGVTLWKKATLPNASALFAN
jgi:2-amino-4-hydroxy-6-hydroxymethyldihydropteridine diphosphokinase